MLLYFHAPSKCLRNVYLLCKCNVMSSSNINVPSDSKFTAIAPVHLRVSRGKKITLSLSDKVKLLDLRKQKT